MYRDLEIRDRKTGEILEGVPVWVGRKHNPYGRRFFMTNQNALEIIAKDKDLTLEPKNVLIYLWSRLDFDNFIRIPQAEVAEELGMKKENVSRAISLLVKKGILFRSEKVGRSYGFRLNPNYGWKGKTHQLSYDHKGHLRIVGGTQHQGVTPESNPTPEQLEAAGQQRLFD